MRRTLGHRGDLAAVGGGGGAERRKLELEEVIYIFLPSSGQVLSA